MTNFQVALMQLAPCGNDPLANMEKGVAACRRAKAMGADLALFPEMWNIGYAAFQKDVFAEGANVWRGALRWAQDPRNAREIDALRAEWQAQAISQDSPFFIRFRDLARELDMAIAITYLQQWPIAPRNAVSVIDRHGEVVLTYAKVHTCDFDAMECSCTPGDDFYVCDLDTAGGVVKLGAMICYDREFPESARVLMLKGAEVIVVPNSCGMEQHRLMQLNTRAYENMTGVAMANYAAPKDNGHSAAYSPIAFGAAGSLDTTLVLADEREGVFMASFDMDAIRQWRSRETWGNTFRRPHRYGMLIAREVNEPFVRLNAGGERYDTAFRQR
jgi:predicted amidohydrolase